ncbi:hypothetical protein LFL97_29580 [Burkholderia sp. JSH-S8]|uniref:hypothetical protein n=1 Tax=Burkholderia stagnalis TaxID=1503054 RepID=UPI000F807A93|nr:hypothetical protein [Burkholderia stagnalis]WGS44736.1 hypothetical protein LFL97_29580 [Burkholderia sp. JSH-S8]
MEQDTDARGGVPPGAGFTRRSPIFVPPAAGREMTRDAYRLLQRALALRRSIAADASGPSSGRHHQFIALIPQTKQICILFPYLSSGSHIIHSCLVTIGKKTPY